jgi:hypothetical protein
VIRTILISGLLTKERLDRVFEELRRVAADTAATDDLVVVVNSTAGNFAATLAFIENVLGDEWIRCLAERASVKVYEARSVATLFAFAFGPTRELSADGKIGFDLGERIVQVGNPDHYDQDGCLTPQFVERWQAYKDAVLKLLRRLGLQADRDLDTRFWAQEGRLDLSAQECLRRGLVSRVF